MSVHNVATKQNGDFDVIDGSAFIPDENFPGELKVEFPGSNVNRVERKVFDRTCSDPAGDYWIIETDYTNYSVVYSCVDFLLGAIKLEFAWILSREKNLDPEMVIL